MAAKTNLKNGMSASEEVKKVLGPLVQAESKKANKQTAARQRQAAEDEEEEEEEEPGQSAPVKRHVVISL